MGMTGNIEYPSATERLARAALELHRLAKTASEVQHLPSPMTGREKNTKNAADPTSDTALDPRRQNVAGALVELNANAELLLVSEELGQMFATITAALNQWDRP